MSWARARARTLEVQGRPPAPVQSILFGRRADKGRQSGESGATTKVSTGADLLFPAWLLTRYAMRVPFTSIHIRSRQRITLGLVRMSIFAVPHSDATDDSDSSSDTSDRSDVSATLSSTDTAASSIGEHDTSAATELKEEVVADHQPSGDGTNGTGGEGEKEAVAASSTDMRSTGAAHTPVKSIGSSDPGQSSWTLSLRHPCPQRWWDCLDVCSACDIRP